MIPSPLKKFLPYIALLGAHCIWGINFVISKITLQEFPVYTLAFFRFAFASLFLAPFFLVQTKKVKMKAADLPKLVAIGIFIVTLNIAFFFTGLKTTEATSASVISLVIPILSVLTGWWFLRERIFLINILGVILGLLGSLIIIGVPQIFLGTVQPERLLGNFLVFLASVAFVAGAILSREMLKKYPSLTVTAFSFMVGMITFFPLAAYEYIQNPTWMETVTPLGIFGLIFMTLLSSISAYFLFEWGLAKTSVAIAGFFQYLEPVVASSLAVVILGETISYSLIIGGFLIVAGVLFGTLAKEPHHRIYKAHRV